ncbi:MAG: hypothetical protein K5888_04715 [Lachnospiraceae bacterium]|nr:hypothetical protein [Lachnospiraceae bacterium]
MTDQEILNEINKYAETVLGDIDPQKTPVSTQLEKLKPKMEEIASKSGLSVEDVFIKYMDLASAQKVKMEKDFKDTMEQAGVTDLGSLPF